VSDILSSECSTHNPSEDPTILSGTLRSTLDVFDEYDDAEIVRFMHASSTLSCNIFLQFEALRRVHLIPSGDTAEEDPEAINVNVFHNLDAVVSEGGENFSTGYVCQCKVHI
jgi:ABC-type multidrug transport system fused ATPase/permease subunit